MRKLIALLAATAMLLALLAGCAGSEKPAAESAAPSESAAASAEAAPNEESAAPESASTEESAAPETPAAEPVAYPLTGDDLTISYWYSAPGYTKWVSSNNDYMCIPYAEEATGVHLEFVECSEAAVTEQFNLMIASGEWTDLLPVSERYTGGLSQAYNDDVVFDMTDLVTQYMPDYMAVYNAQADTVKQAALTDGMMLAFAQIADGTYSGNGLVTRGDWLATDGYTFSGSSITLSDFTDLMYKMVNEYGAEHAFYVEPNGQISSVAPAFDTSIPSMSSSSAAAANYVVDGTVVSGWTSEGTRKYVEWFKKLVDDGILDRDFPSASTDRGEINTACATGKAGMWQANADKLDEMTNWADEANKGIVSQPVPPIVADDNTTGETKWNAETNLVSFKMSISSTSEDKGELICKWMNYFWTEPGSVLANYGVQGQSFDYDESGNVSWLDLITNEPQGANCEMATVLYTFQRFCAFYNDNDKLLSTFTDNALSAVNLWTQAGTSERQYPNFAGLTTEETSETTTKLTDICTYGQQSLLKWMTGTEELTDDAWNTYLQTMNDLGIGDVLAVYQNAYDEYQAGTRHIASTTSGGAGGPPM